MYIIIQYHTAISQTRPKMNLSAILNTKYLIGCNFVCTRHRTQEKNWDNLNSSGVLRKLSEQLLFLQINFTVANGSHQNNSLDLKANSKYCNLSPRQLTELDQSNNSRKMC